MYKKDFTYYVTELFIFYSSRPVIYGTHSLKGPYIRVDDDNNILVCYSIDDRVNSSEDPIQKERDALCMDDC